MVSVASAFTKSFRSSSHLLASLPALLWVLVDLSSPGFHSAAFLVHLCFALCWVSQGVSPLQFLLFLYETKLSPPTRQTSENKKERSAPRWRLSRETNQVSRAFTTVLSRSAAQARARLCVSMFSSASFVLFFTYSIQSSRLSSWLVVFFSSSSSNENLLSWSHSLCVLIFLRVSSLISSSQMSFPPVSFLILYFLVRLYDDTKHSALSGAEHSFSCSFAVVQVP